MSRFTGALCAFVLAATPVVAIANHSTNFERPEAFRHAVNPLIGDASFIDRFGTPPSPGTDPQLRVSTHLSFVHDLLSRRDASALTPEQRDARRENLARLREYIDAGVFPLNERYRDETRPCFIDDDGRICAVGYLVEQSAGRAAAERINTTFQYAFLSQMESPEIDEWIASSGLSRLELSLIQPGYAPNFQQVTVAQVGATTVKVSGYVTDYGCCCNLKYVSIDFGDAIWTSKAHDYGQFASMNAEHTYPQPGAYTIVAKAVSEDWCGNRVETRSWLVTLGVPALKLNAVQTGGGPPYGVYLQTSDEINLQCLSSAMVRWSADAQSEPTSWYLENGVYRTPVHSYPNAGVRTISVANNYLANCTTNQAGTVTVNVNGLLNPAPAEVSTWGRIKAMYR